MQGLRTPLLRARPRLGLSLVAGSAGLASVSVAKANEKKVPPFSLSSSRYDQSTYLGRLSGVLQQIDPRTLLVGQNELSHCKGLLEDFKRTGEKPPGVSDEDMWKAKNTVDAIIHPVTQEPMFILGRMSAFVPMNAPVCAIMLNAHSVAGVIFAQWLNQTYNVMNNYVNRSSLDVNWEGLLKPYVLAVTVSCSIALAARRALVTVPSLARLGIFVPYFAVISAGACNVAFTRMDEWAGRGICIFSPEGQELGMSKMAGQQAVLKTIATRSVCLPIPILMIPPVIMSILPFTGAARMAAEGVVILSCMSLALPCALAMLPQEMELPTASLEPEYQTLRDSRGEIITRVFANKGL